MFYQLFLSPQVKRWAIITYKHGISELHDECQHHGIFADGGAFVPTQEKKKKKRA